MLFRGAPRPGEQRPRLVLRRQGGGARLPDHQGPPLPHLVQKAHPTKLDGELAGGGSHARRPGAAGTKLHHHTRMSMLGVSALGWQRSGLDGHRLAHHQSFPLGQAAGAGGPGLERNRRAARHRKSFCHRPRDCEPGVCFPPFQRAHLAGAKVCARGQLSLAQALALGQLADALAKLGVDVLASPA